MTTRIEERKAIDALVGFCEMIEEKNFSSTVNFFDDLFAVYSGKLKNEVL